MNIHVGFVLFVLLPHMFSLCSGCGVRDDSHEHVSLSDSNQETYALLLRMS